jgi:2-phosphoglycerate kinase
VTDVRVVLIGGPSNVGKSTVAQGLADRLGWSYVSTDKLARHPGRPWLPDGSPVTKPYVVDHFRSLSVDELFTAVVEHYTRMWPGIEQLVRAHATDPAAGRLVLEGSALWPPNVATLEIPGVAAFWLTAPSELLRARMYAGSRYGERTADEQSLVDKFLGRAVLYNERMADALTRLGQSSVDVGAEPPAEQTVERILRLVAAPSRT